MAVSLHKLGDYILKRLSNYHLTISYENHELEIRISQDALYNVLSFLQHDTHCHFEQFLDLIIMDFPNDKKRFDLIYIVRSLKNNWQARVVTSTDSEISSIAEIYRNALWLEREGWEMFGIFFKNNRDLRRLFTDDTLRGYPLRKNYPDYGFSDYIFDEKKNRFLSVPLLLKQEKKTFDLKSPWQGPMPVLHKEENMISGEYSKENTSSVEKEEIRKE